RSDKPIRVGVVGVGRGQGFAKGAGPHLGMELVALCDTWEERLTQLGRELSVETYTDYDEFLTHDMDAVILANYFHEHAPFAIKALGAGKHVMSETSACLTLAQGVALIEAVERSGRIYMFAENYPYMVFNQEMRRLYQAGQVGEFRYGEGEYVHPMDSEGINRLSPGEDHWRNWVPATYYCTHALAPVMFITDTWPAKVNAFVIPYDEDDEVQFGRTAVRHDVASMIAVRMDSGAVVKLLQVSLRGHGVWVRIHGNRGLMENLRWGDTQMLRVRREPFDKEAGEPEERIYRPDFPEHHAAATQAGHGGGDFFMNYHFAEAIRRGEQPFLDVYRGVAMSIVGVQAYRSALDDSAPVAVPDLRDSAVRKKYADDTWSPDPREHRAGQPWPSVLGDVRPTAEGLAYARSIWHEMGYGAKEGG
ncbi:MAG: Gfo/Idh/MocA family oxidoreductase, partial [Dehalococcoidia bacterium]|nr:Gfo/Idh/MocA family oxidoreductase [Dehalococcoidia bacterium]